MEFVTITSEDYEQLLKDSDFLNALIAAGVDNWNGYDEALAILKEWNVEE